MRPSAVLLALAVIVSACAAELSTESGAASFSELPSATTSPIGSLAPSPSSSATPSLGPSPMGPAVPGLRFDDVLAGWRDFGLTCEDGLSPAGPHPPQGLMGAQCTRQDLVVFINHWPDGGVLSMEALSGSSPDSDISASSREALLRRFAATEYQGSDRDAAEMWLFANRPDDCGQGCHLIIGAASWFHAVGSSNTDQISLGPAH